jgi:predicted dehydrogenase
MPAFLNNCSGNASKLEGKKWKEVVVPELLPKAPNGRPLKAGLVGCGSRGTGAACDFLDAGDDLQITALGDVFPDKLDECRKILEQRGQLIPDTHCFLGFDAYRQVIDSGVDVVLMCTPPVFRPVQFEYAVSKNKHCFIEKPCAVDPVGVRKVILAGKRAAQTGLSVISGTCLRSEKDYIETYRRVAGGAIGEIVSAHVSRMGAALWYVRRHPKWSDMEYMLRNWANFCWTSGDHIVEQFIHEIDVMAWFTGDKHPIRAKATGGRQRRITGDMYDNFSVEYIYENGHRAHCTTRQLDGCDVDTAVMVYGTKGFTDCAGTIYHPDGSIAWQYPYPAEGDTDQSMAIPDPYVQEHIRLVSAIRTNRPVNDTEQHAQSTLMAIMGREAAYTGKFITWEEILASPMQLGPETYELGSVAGGVKEEIPLAGTPPQMLNN